MADRGQKAKNCNSTGVINIKVVVLVYSYFWNTLPRSGWVFSFAGVSAANEKIDSLRSLRLERSGRWKSSTEVNNGRLAAESFLPLEIIYPFIRKGFICPASTGKPVLYLPGSISLLTYIILTAGVLALLLNDHPLMLYFQRAWFPTIYTALRIEKCKK
jgi:hypothetical protein